MGQLLLFINVGGAEEEAWWKKNISDTQSCANISMLNGGPSLDDYIVPSDLPDYGVTWDCDGGI